ncbi:MAG: bifunctional 3-hydroxydecanoyl-ACP dehydratase/trans-2-decenoyl-ACP isomerase, partial [Elusimicrobiota bacterium]
MTFEEFQKRSRFDPDEIIAYAQGHLLKDAPDDLPGLPGFLLLPFHEVTRLEWDESTGTGVIEAVRRNRFDDWFYGCHFPGDPVMPGCWGVDAVWQCLKFFAAWRGLAGCDKTLGMENVSFFGQIRPYDRDVVYRVEILSVERSGADILLTGKGSVAVDGVPVYTISSAQVGTAFWQAPDAQPRTPAPAARQTAMRPLRYEEFAARDHFSRAELVALSRG